MLDFDLETIAVDANGLLGLAVKGCESGGPLH
jgi:hypothetical protein